MAENSDEKPKIIVDSDWKEEAQKEKEQADRETREAAGGELPPPALAEIVQMILVQASIGLGGFQDPQSGQRIPPNFALAQHYIDLLALLQTKTEGNLDDQEKQLLEGALHELRMAFVQLVNTAGQAQDAPEKPEA